MAKINQSFVDKLKTTGKQEQISLGYKLFLVMSPKGAKSYRYIFRHPVTKAIKKKNLGNADVMSLESALSLAISFNSLLEQGVDPVENFKAQFKPVERVVFTLSMVVEDWYVTKGMRLSEKHLRDRLARFKRYLLPHFGEREVLDISLFEAREVIKAIFERAPHMGEKVARDLRELGDHAVDMGVWSANLLAPIKRSFPRPKAVNNPCIRADELPEFLCVLARSRLDFQTRLLIEFQLLTMVRANEVVTARWVDVDFVNAVWRIPAENMKMNKAHDVPLSSQAVALLLELRKFNADKPFVFPHRSNKNSHCSANTANQAFYRALGYKDKMTPHGMRSLARTWLADNGVAFEVAEACLAHESGSQVSKAYNRTSYFNQRVEAMQKWGDFVEACRNM
ncbi:tyrosine-type recombinase/integrase [Histophilus somni]|uniref:tyrosine-type recombinase/integrase n=1 Tax=Histophilus somni TaxID=731 RepID=UPI00094B6A5E|nr:site-specific integrase [Histophilus somni]